MVSLVYLTMIFKLQRRFRNPFTDNPTNEIILQSGKENEEEAGKIFTKIMPFSRGEMFGIYAKKLVKSRFFWYVYT